MIVPGSANALLLKSASSAYQITNSLRFRASNSAYLTRTPAGAGNRRTFTVSFWMKRGALDTGTKQLFGQGSGVAGGGLALYISSTLNLRVYNGTSDIIATSALLRDPAAHMHVQLAFDTTQATATDRMRLYLNGVEVAYGTYSAPAQNTDMSINQAVEHRISGNTSGSFLFDGLISDFHFVDGAALTPSAFGETNTTTGAWVPKRYAGTYGTNGFFLNFANAASTTTIGEDAAGSNDWTTSGISVTAGVTFDQSLDTPSNNHCTWNSAENMNAVTLGWANTRATGSGAAARTVRGTMSLGPTTPVYVELTMTTYFNVNYPMLGFSALESGTTTGTIGTGSGGRFLMSYPSSANGSYANDNGTTTFLANSTGFSTNGDVIMLAFDPNTGKYWMGLNGTWYNSGNPAAGTNPTGTHTPFIGLSMTPAVTTYDTSVVDLNCGQRPFAYTPPTGFNGICTANLPTPSIINPSVQFSPVIYTGTGSSLNVTGVGFQPDLVWIKGRSGATDHALYDSARGVQLQLESNTTTGETTETTGLTAFGADGFTVGALAQVNTNAATYVAWNWKEGVTPGFDIVTYTGNNASRTIGHSLNAVPHMMIIKWRTGGTSQNWMVYHRNSSATPQDDFLTLNTVNGVSTSTAIWDNTNPTSSVFSLGAYDDTNRNSATFVAYLWTEIAGFSRIGSYVGNSSSDGPFVWCGFRPAFVMIKSTAGGSQWMIYDDQRDGYNVDNDHLNPDDNATEATDDDIDLLANGFKLRRSSTNFNNSGDTFVFAAFARSPFKTANAR
jgi:hypothetical protein